MNQHSDLKRVLAPHFPLHGARLDCLARLVLALLKVSTVSLPRLATALSPKAARASSERRAARFLGFDLAQELIARFVLSLIGEEKVVLSLDRTEHLFGHVSINVLTLGLAREGLAFPLFWTCLGKAGSSSTAERIALLERALKVIGPERLLALTADREFVGREWFAFLSRMRVPFVIRLKADTRATYRGLTAQARAWFHRFTPGETGQLRRPCRLLGQRLWLVAQRLSSDEWLFLAASQKPARALALYAQRWKIECLFGALKSRGFNFEQTHLTQPERIERLFGVLTLALVLSHRVGELVSSRVPIPVKEHGRALYSTFRYGLDHLRQLLHSGGSNHLDWYEVPGVLSGT